MTLNEHGIDTDRITVSSVVRCLQGGSPLDGGGRVRTVQIDHRDGGRLAAHTVDQLTPQGSTDLLHVNDITGIE